MVLTVIAALIQSLLYDLVLFYVGKILSNSISLRKFLGLQSGGEREEDYVYTSYWIEKIGQIVMLIALISAFASIISTLIALSNM